MVAENRASDQALTVEYLVFSQAPLLSVITDAALARRVRHLFGISWELASRAEHLGQGLLVVGEPGAALEVRVLIAERPCGPADLALAREAEHRGGSPGLAALAGRCPQVWELQFASGHRGRGVALAAIALACLGPVMPSDGSRLVGVRGARALEG